MAHRAASTLRRVAVVAAGLVLAGAAVCATPAAAADATPPNTAFSLWTPGAGSSFVAGSVLWFNPAAPGSATAKVTANDPDTSVQYVTWGTPPAGWSPAGSNDSSPVSAGTYERTFTWGSGASTGPFTATATNPDGATSSAVTFTANADSAPPTKAAGSVTLNTPGWLNNNGTVTLNFPGIGQFSDPGGSGVGIRRIERRLGTGDGFGGCIPSGGWSTVVTNPASSPVTDPGGPLASGQCAEYRYVVADNVGNDLPLPAPLFRGNDTTNPTAAWLSFTYGSNPQYQYKSGSTMYVNPAQSGSFQVDVLASDPESGINKTTFPAVTPVAGWTPASPQDAFAPGPYSYSYTWTGTTSSPAATPSIESPVVTNKVGRTASAPFTIATDTAVPSVNTLTLSYTNGWDSSTGTITTSGTMSDSLSGMGSMQLQRDDAPLTGGTCGSYTNTWTNVGTPALNGAPLGTVSDPARTSGRCYTYRVLGTDHVGNTTPLASGSVAKVDGDFPTGAISGPANTNISGNSLGTSRISGTAADLSSGVGSVTLRYVQVGNPANFGTIGTLSGAGASTWGFTWDTTGRANGQYHLYLDVTDVSSNATPNAATLDVLIDNTPPTLTFLSFTQDAGAMYWDNDPSNNHVYVGTTAPGDFQVEFTADDPETGIASVTYPGAGAAGWTPGSSAVVAAPGPYTQIYYWSAGAADVGARNVVATSGSGVTATAPFIITRDDTPPGGTAAITYAKAWDDTTVDLTFSGAPSDAGGSGVLKTVLERDEAPMTSGSCGTYSGSWTELLSQVDPGNPFGLGDDPLAPTYDDGPVVNATCYSYRLVVTDHVGNTTTIGPVTAKIDNVKPTGTIDAAPASPLLGSKTFTGTVADAASGPATLTLRWLNLDDNVSTGVVGTPDTTFPGGVWSTGAWSTAGVPDGNYRLSAEAVDVAGNLKIVDTRTVIVDNSPPVLTFTGFTASAPAACTSWAGGASTTMYFSTAPAGCTAGGDWTVNATATDAPGGMQQVTFPDASATGVTPSPAAPAVDGTAPYSWHYLQSLGATSSGPLTIVATGNSGATTSKAIDFALDNTGPTGQTVTGPGGSTAPAWWTNAASAPVTFAKGTDADAGLKSWKLVRRDAPASGAACGTYGAYADVVADPAASPYTDSSITAGSTCYQYAIVAMDKVSNTSTVADTADTLRVDRTAPTVAMDPIPANVRGTIAISGTSGDDWSGVASLVVEASPGAIAVCSPTGATWTCPGVSTTGIADGVYSVTATATDAAGNTTTTPVQTVRVDNAVPTGAVTIAPGTNPQWQHLVPGPTPKLYVNTGTGTSGDVAVTTAITETGSGVLSADYPSLGSGWTETPAGGVVASPGPYTVSYTWAAGAASPGLQSVALADNAGNLGGAGFDVTSDTSAPTGVTLDQPNGPTANPSVSFSTGGDGTGSGVGTWKLQRRSTAVTGPNTCDTGAWTAWGDLAASVDAPSPFVDGSVALNSCYQYRVVVTDHVGNSVTVDEPADVATVEPAGLVVVQSGGSTDVTEGAATDTFTVKLRTVPASAVTVTVGGDLQVVGGPATLTFAPGTWNIAQTVTVTATNDAVDEVPDPHAGTVTLTTGSGDAAYGALAPVTVTAQVTDDDVAGITVSPAATSVAVDEASAATGDTYTVVLDSKPAGNVDVALANGDGQVTVAPASLAFTPGNWNVAQTVTVRAVDDPDDEAATHPGVVTQTVTSTDPLYAPITLASVTATVTDDDTSGVTVTPTTGLTLDEAAVGTTASYTVELTSRPTSSVTINVVGDAQASVSPSSLVFTAGTWSTAQTVTLTVVDDAIAEGAHTAVASHTLTSTDPLYGPVAVPAITATVADNDVPGVELTPTSGLSATEGGAGSTYQVRLKTQPIADVQVALAGGADLAPMATLTFTSGNWNSYQTVTVAAVQDDVDEPSPETATVAHTVTSTDPKYTGLVVTDQTVAVTDDDDTGITVNLGGGVAVAEAGATSDSFTVVLDSEPTGTVTVAVTPDAQVTVDTPTLTFTPATWSLPKTVTVTAVDDAYDETDPHAGMVALGVTSPGDAQYAALTPAPVAASVSDDDTAAFVVTLGTLSVNEAGATSSTYTIALASRPTVDVVVGLTPDAQVTRAPAALTFTDANWATPQTVTVTAVDDQVVESVTHSGSIGHTITTTDPSYSLLGIAAKAVDVADDDTPGVLVDDLGGVAVDEGGTPATDTYTVRLTAAPQAGQTVTVTTASSDGETTVLPTTLTFDGSNWSTARVVTVSAVDDDTDEPSPHVGAITNTVTSSDPLWSAVTAAGVTASITDDDTTGATVTPLTGLALDEASVGTTATYSMVLDSEPLASVTVAVTGDADATAAPATLTFTAGDWSLAQTVTVTVVDDPIFEGSHTATLTNSFSSGDPAYGALAPMAVTANVTDNDVPGVEIDDAGGVTAAEGGATGTYRMRLKTQPANDVVLSFATGSQVDAIAPLTFTSGDWNAWQTLTVTATDDDVDEASPHAGQIATAVASSDPAYAVVTVTAEPVAITDDDVAGITVDESGGVAVAEAGTTSDSFSVELDSEPTGTVTIAVTPDGQVAATPSTLTFDASDWDTPKFVTVTAVDDAIAEAPSHPGVVSLGVSSPADAKYAALTPAPVTSAVADDDVAGYIVTPAGPLTVNEAGATSATYTVRLTSEPIADVVVAAAGDAQVGAAPGSLTFTPGNWASAQTVTVTAVDDAVVEAATHAGAVAHTITTTDPTYGLLALAPMAVDVADDDTPGVVVAQGSGVTAIEGGATGTYTVRLAAAPQGAQTVTFALVPDAEVTVAPTSITFTNANWSTPVTVTVTAVDDDVDETSPHAGSIVENVTSTDPLWSAVTAATVPVAIGDDDTAALTIDATGLGVAEAGATSDTYTVQLATKPSGTVTIALTDDVYANVAPTTLTFDGTDWSTPKTVTLTAVDDAIFQGPHTSSVTYAVTSPDGNYAGLTVPPTVADVLDDDAPDIEVTPASGLTAAEGGAGSTYQVRLGSEPTADVVVSFATGTQLQPIADLTFTSGNWNSYQTVTVAAVQDDVDEAATHTGTIAHTVTSTDFGYTGFVVAPQSVAIADDDTAALHVDDLGGIAVSESGTTTDTFELSLESEPTANVTVTLAPDPQVTTPSPAAPIVFTPGDWDQPQTVTVRAVDDAVDEAATHPGVVALTVASTDPVYAAVTGASATATVTDDDTAGITVTPPGGNLAVSEAGATSDTYTVVLDTKPVANVTVALTDDAQVTASSDLVFTPTNWSVAQTVTVTAVDDQLVEAATHTGTVTHVVTSTDPAYGALTIPARTVDVTDDDTPGVLVNELGTIDLDEAAVGTTDTYSVVLTEQPAQDVTVAVAPDAEQTTSTSSLTFTNGNWNSPQTVTVTVVDDGLDETDPHTGTITHTVSSTDPLWGAVTAADATTHIADDDTAAVRLTPTSGLAIAEAGTTSATYSVVLDAIPAGNVTVTPSGDPDATVSGAVTFTPGTWNTPQTVTVTAVDDQIFEGPHTSTITHAITSTDPVYAALTPGTVTANVTDDDIPGIDVTPSSGLTAAEGGAGSTYTITLRTEPAVPVLITLGVDTQLQPLAPVTLDSSNWSTGVVVPVAAVDDQVDEASTHTGTITHTISTTALGYSTMTVPDQSVAITDDDDASITVDESGSVDVAEAGTTTDTFTVVLGSEPTGNVVVGATTPDGQTAATASVTFTPTDWSTPKAITVTAVDDAVDEAATHDGVVVLATTSTDPIYGAITPAPVTAHVTDDDTAGVTVTPTSGLAVTEGGAAPATYTVVLATKPTAPVTVTLAEDAQVAVGADLVFTQANWATAQPVSVTAVDDPVVEAPTHAGQVVHSVTSADTTYAGIVPSPVDVDVTDDDLPGLTIDDLGGVAVTEGGSTDTYTVRLAKRPAPGVTVTVTPAGGTQISTAPATLSFDDTSWNVAQTVTVTATNDGVDEPDPDAATATNAVASADARWGAVATASVPVVVHDDDTAGVLVTQAGPFAFDEDSPAPGSTATYTVELTSVPTADVDVAVNAPADVDTAGTTTLHFTPGTWNAAQTVTFGTKDDSVYELPTPVHTRTITHVATSTDPVYNAITPIDPVAMGITDNDIPGITVSKPSLTATEGGPGDTYTVRLDTQPTADVVVTPTGTQVGVGAPLTFTTGNWSTPQTVTVTATNDDVDEHPDTHAGSVAMAVTSTDPVYAGWTLATLPVAITDNDAAGVTVTPGSTALAVAEAGATSDTYTVVLDSEPTVPVTISLTAPASQVTLSTPTLTFTTGNWSTAQTVTVTAVDDGVDETDPHSVTVTHAATSGDTHYSGIAVSAQPVDIADDDTAGVVVTPNSGLAVAEATAATGDSFTVQLSSQPAGDVTIALAPDPQVTVSAPTLTFTSTNWATAQTVTVKAVNDDIDEAATHPGTVVTTATSSADPAYAGIAVADVSAVVTDDDTAGVLLTQTGGSTDVVEGVPGVTDTYSVVLKSQPTADVTIAITDGAQATATPTSLTFTAANWNAPQIVTVAATLDNDIEHAHTQLITHAVSSTDPTYGSPPVTVPDVTANITDDDVAGAAITPTTVTVGEDGTSATYSVALTAKPATNVTIALAGDTQVDALPASLTFTSGNWNLPQIVNVVAKPDAIDEGPHSGLVTHTMTSTDPEFNGAAVSPVTVNVTDDDTAGVSITPTATAATEGGAVGGYDVALTSEPTSAVNVTLTGTPGQLDLPGAPLTFTAGNWSTPQHVVVTAHQDFVAEGTHTATVTHGTTSSDAKYATGALTIANTTVTITDDDIASFVVTPAASPLAEGAPVTWNLSLSSEPIAPVTVTVTGDADGSVAPAPTVLTFTSANWATPQPVNGTIVQDLIDEADPQTATFTHAVTSTDPTYAALTIAPQVVTVTDDDVASITVNPAPPGPIAVAEGGATGSYTIALGTQPLADVTIDVSELVGPQVTAAPSTLTFTSTNWASAQPVTVTAINDDVDEAATHGSDLTHVVNSTDPAYAALSMADMHVDVADNDTAGINLAATLPDTSVTEGSLGDTVDVTLSSKPIADVTITFTGTQVATGSPTLTFTSANWNVAQSLPVTALDDDVDEADPHAGSIAATVSTTTDPTYTGVTATPLAVAVHDDDTADVVITQAAPNDLDENTPTATQTYQVRLASEPTFNVVVNLTPDAVRLGATPTTLTFTPGNWSADQSVAVNAIDDTLIEADPHTAVVTHDTASSDPNYASGVLSINDASFDIDDNDIPGVKTTPASPSTVEEGGITAQYTVELESKPAADVTISPMPSTTGLTWSVPSITFTPTNWHTAQTVTLVAVDDQVDETSPQPALLTHVVTSTDPLYPSTMIVADASASIVDNDVSDLVITPASGLSVSEATAGTPATYHLALTSKPTAAVTVTFGAGTQLTTSVPTVTLDASNWQTGVDVDANAVNDAVYEGPTPHTGTVTHAMTSPDPMYDGETGPAQTIAITDNDVAGVTVTQTGTTDVTEGSATPDTYTVVLTSEPTANVTIALAMADGQTAPTPASLTFTPTNWSTAQTVTVAADDDAIDEAPVHPGVITHTASSTDPYYTSPALSIADVTANVTDDDVAGVTLSYGATLAVAEGGTTQIIHVTLDSEPTADVTVAIAGDADATVAPSSVTIAPSAWQTGADVTVTAVDDHLIEGPHTATLTTTVTSTDPFYTPVTVGPLTAAVGDNDAAGVTVTETAGATAVDEGAVATTDAFDVVLDAEPIADVTITVATPDGQTTASPSTLVFTALTWNMPQTVTVTAVNDDDDEPLTHTGSVTLTMATTDPDFAPSGTPMAITPVDVDVTDNDTSGVDISPTAGLTVGEDGTTSGVDVKLKTKPTGPVSVTLTSGDPRLEVAPPGSTVTLSFTPADWNTAQHVDLGAIDDDIDQSSTTGQVAISVASAADAQYALVTAPPLDVTITDDDTAGVDVSFTTAQQDLDEAFVGTTVGLDVVLTSEPVGQVTVDVAGDVQQLTVAPTSLTFTAANWNVAQTVTATVVDDDVDEAAVHTSTVTFTTSASADTTYAAVTPATTFDVDIADNDTAGVLVAPTGPATWTDPTTPAPITEDGTVDATYTVVLVTKPTAAVTVTFASVGGLLGVPPALTFDATNWNVPQTVTVHALQNNAAGGTVTATLTQSVTSPDTNYAGLSPEDINGANVDDITASITDDDVPSWTWGTLTPAAGVVEATPAAPATYTLTMNTAPAGDVIANLAATGPNASRITVAPSSLTFTPTDFATVRTVTVTAVDNGFDDGDVSVDIVATADPTSDDGYELDTAAKAQLEAPVSVPVVDDDSASVKVDTQGIVAVNEAAATTHTIKVMLGAQPTGPVTVTLAPDAQQTLSTTTLTFGPTDWNVAQDVVVTAVDDDSIEALPTHHGTITVTTASAADPAFDALTTAPIDVVVTDNDVAGLLVIDDGAFDPVDEDGTKSEVVTFKLTSKPVGAVKVRFANHTRFGVLGQYPITLDASNWNTGVPATRVTIQGLDDGIAQGDGSEPWTFIVTAADPADVDYDNLAVAPRLVTVLDNDTQGIYCQPNSGWEAAPDHTPLTEDATTHTSSCDLRLNAQATAPVTVTFAAPLGQIDVPAPITFAPGEIGPVPVTVSATDDKVDETSPHAAKLTYTIASTDPKFAATATPLLGILDTDFDITDDDTAGLTVTPSTVDVKEGDTSTADEVQIALSSQPTKDVVITPDPGAQLQLGTGPVIPLTFTPTNWATPQKLTVSAKDDTIVEGPHTGQVTFKVVSADTAYSNMAATPVTASITDDDVATVKAAATGGSTAVAEAGGTDTVLVSLGSTPSADVKVTLITDAQVTVTPATLTFTPANATTGQTVTIKAVQDTVVEGPHTGILSFTLETTDAVYAAAPASAPVEVAITDDDIAAVKVLETDGTKVSEAGETTDTYTVALSGQPSKDVTITPDGGTQITVTPAKLVFTKDNWATAQTVTVKAVDDQLDEQDPHTVELKQALATEAAGWTGTTAQSVTVQVTDNDTAAIQLTQTDNSTKVVEGGETDSVTLQLTSAPAKDVTVVAKGDEQVKAAEKPIVFTASKWKDPVKVEITAIDDKDDEGDHKGTVSFSVATDDTVYSKATVTPLTVDIVDNDDDSTTEETTDDETTDTTTVQPRTPVPPLTVKPRTPRDGGSTGSRRTEAGSERTDAGRGASSSFSGTARPGAKAPTNVARTGQQLGSDTAAKREPKQETKRNAALERITKFVQDHWKVGAPLGALGLLLAGAASSILKSSPAAAAKRSAAQATSAAGKRSVEVMAGTAGKRAAQRAARRAAAKAASEAAKGKRDWHLRRIKRKKKQDDDEEEDGGAGSDGDSDGGLDLGSDD